MFTNVAVYAAVGPSTTMIRSYMRISVWHLTNDFHAIWSFCSWMHLTHSIQENMNIVNKTTDKIWKIETIVKKIIIRKCRLGAIQHTFDHMTSVHEMCWGLVAKQPIS